MIITKPKPAFLFFASLLLFIIVAISCNNNTEKKEEAPKADTPAAQKMDTANTRPVKTTN